MPEILGAVCQRLDAAHTAIGISQQQLRAALVRRELWISPTSAGSRDYRDARKLSADVLNRLLLIAYRPP